MAGAGLLMLGKLIAGASALGGLVQQNMAANAAEQNMRKQRKDAEKQARATAKEGVDQVDIELGTAEDTPFAASMLRTSTPTIGGVKASKVGGLR